jgi:hypothetical protein
MLHNLKQLDGRGRWPHQLRPAQLMRLRCVLQFSKQLAG